MFFKACYKTTYINCYGILALIKIVYISTNTIIPWCSCIRNLNCKIVIKKNFLFNWTLIQNLIQVFYTLLLSHAILSLLVCCSTTSLPIYTLKLNTYLYLCFILIRQYDRQRQHDTTPLWLFLLLIIYYFLLSVCILYSVIIIV